MKFKEANSLRSKAYVLVFDGLADWEPALAMCEIRKSEKLEIVSVGFSKEIVTTMGGFRIVPDIALNAVDPDEAALFILPGGEMWERGGSDEVRELLGRLRSKDVPVAAICAATLEVVRAGLTHGVKHTSNALGYLKAMLPEYADSDFYEDQPAVLDGNLITASGLGSVDFAYRIIKLLKIYNDEEAWELYEMFKNGIIPARFMA